MNHNSSFCHLVFTAVAGACLLTGSPGEAVVISTGDGSGNTTAPTNDPGWNNVGINGGGTAVYLGNRWVITADHVGAHSVKFGNQTFQPDVSSAVQLSNPSNSSASGVADLMMFRLTADPGLPTLKLSSSTLSNGTSVDLIGAGRDRAPDKVGWKTQSTDTGVIWTPSSVGLADEIGYELLDTRQLRWGIANVIGGDFLNETTSGTTISRETVFSPTSTVPFPATAVSGDSGGAVFAKVAGGWELAGIIDSMSTLINQPSNAVVFGNRTIFAELSAYQPQISGLLTSLAWQNSTNHLDVDNNGQIEPLDALNVINELNRNSPHPLPIPAAGDSPPPYYDVNGDSEISPLDALVILNRLNNVTTTSEVLQLSHAADNILNAPEPDSIILAAFGFAGILFMRLVRRRKTPSFTET